MGEFATAELPRLQLVEKMLGRAVAESAPKESGREIDDRKEGGVFLQARGMKRKGAVGPVDLELRRGEAHGLAGLLGSGRTETARLIFGVDRSSSGEIWIGGEAVRFRSPREAISRGIGFSSEDRKAEGIFPSLSVRENLVLAMQASRGMLKRIPKSEQLALAERFIAALRIKTPSSEAAIGTLSGGNQQKVLLARWLCMNCQLLILDEPTRGIDVGTKAEIEKLVGELCGEGMAVLFISSELEETVRVCSRVTILRDRKQVGELSGEIIGVEAIMEVIAQPAGKKEEEK